MTMMVAHPQRLPLVAGGDRVYRTRITWRTSWTFVGVYLFIASGSVISLSSNHRAGSSSIWIPAVCASVVLGMAAAFFAARTATAGIFTDDDGIRIRNPFMTARLLWSDIDRFELREEGRHPSICVIILRDGSVFRALGIRAAKGWLRSNTGPAQELVDGLNAELTAARTRDGPHR
jgi:hypothetical protein